jgi:hypothetical protein
VIECHSSQQLIRHTVATISETEARLRLRGPYFCYDWSRSPEVDGTVVTIICRSGVLDDSGAPTGLLVDLRVSRGRAKKREKFNFSVFRRNWNAYERVYQLTISKGLGRKRNWHSAPHEHWGKARIDGDLSWEYWSLDEALAFFCARTHVAFATRPPIHQMVSRKG